jgi:hypothetical protein
MVPFFQLFQNCSFPSFLDGNVPENDADVTGKHCMASQCQQQGTTNMRHAGAAPSPPARCSQVQE